MFMITNKMFDAVFEDIFFFKSSRSTLEPTQPPVQSSIPGSKAAGAWMLTAHRHLTPRLRMSETIPVLPTCLHGVEMGDFTVFTKFYVHSPNNSIVITM